jgi:regulatory protein
MIRVGRKVVATLAHSKVVDMGLHVGQVWDDALAQEVGHAAVYDKALKQALNRLNRRAMSRYDLDFKLKKLEYEQPVRESVLDRLTELGFLDDEAYGRALIEATMRQKPAGPQLLRQKLFQKGVDRSLIERLVSEATDAQDLAPGAVELARKKLRTLTRFDLQTRKRRLYGLLARRGFNPDTISSVMAELGEEIEEGCQREWD